MAKKRLTEKQQVRKHNKELEEYQLKTQGFTGYLYPIKSKRFIKSMGDRKII